MIYPTSCYCYLCMTNLPMHDYDTHSGFSIIDFYFKYLLNTSDNVAVNI